MTEFEEKEKERIEGFRKKIESLISYGNMVMINSEEGSKMLLELDKYYQDVSDWQEFKHKANTEYQKSNEELSDRINKFKKLEAEQAELAKLRKEAEERDRKDREDQIAKEVEERVRVAAREEADRVAKAAEQEKYRLEAEKKEQEEKASIAEAKASIAELRYSLIMCISWHVAWDQRCYNSEGKNMYFEISNQIESIVWK